MDIVWIIVSIVLSVAALTGVIISAVLRKKKPVEDSGLMPQVVMKNIKPEEEPEPSVTEEPSGISGWNREHVPITLLVDDEVLVQTPSARVSIIKAINWWNTAAGFELFKSLGDVSMGMSVPILVADHTTMDESHHNALAYTHLKFNDGEIMSAAIYCTYEVNGRSKAELLRTFAHELGHTLGLDHDTEIPESVMYPSLNDIVPQLTDKDRVLLTTIYGPVAA